MRKKKKLLVALGIVLGIIVGTISLVIAVAVIFLAVFSFSKVKTYKNINSDEYVAMMAGEGKFEELGSFFNMNTCGIWPMSIDENEMGGAVSDICMTYYNPFDAQYLGYMVVDYEPGAYETEIDRLSTIGIDDYIGKYSVSGFSNYELVAMHSDSYYGFVYALTDGKNKIIYVDILFCNFFMDLKYEKYMPAEYFPDGFDARMNNAYEKKMMNKE